LGLRAIGDIKKENAILPSEQAEQTATGKDVLVGGQMAMVRLVAHIAGSWNGSRLDDFAVIIGIFVKVDDGKEVWREAGLVPRPDVERLCLLVSVVITTTAVVGKCDSAASENDQR
jgi:hypothetical protein